MDSESPRLGRRVTSWLGNSRVLLALFGLYVALSGFAIGYWFNEVTDNKYDGGGLVGIYGDVPYSEVREFLREDGTDQYVYDVGDFNCVEFSLMLSREARRQGIALDVVRLELGRLDEPDHLVVGCRTCDEGYVFIEPQNDVRIYPEIGKDDVVGISIMETSWVPL